MITFTLCLLALIAGYFIYGRFIERVFGPDDRKTPADRKSTRLNSSHWNKSRMPSSA